MPKGFFSGAALATKPAVSLIPQCGSCGLYLKCKSPKMPVSGEGQKGILIVGEGPGAVEDRQGIPFIGPSGQLLQETLAKFGIDMRRDCWITNSVICRTSGDDRTPTPQEIEYCRPNLTKAIQELNPSTIICLGGPATQSVLGEVWKDDQGYAIGRWSGWRIPCQSLNAWIFPTWHPAFMIYEEKKDRDNGQVRNSKTLRMFWERHLAAAASKKGRPWKDGPPNWMGKVDVIMDDKQAAERVMLMVECRPNPKWPLAIDFETNCRKPDRKEAEIHTCAISDGRRAISFPWHGKAIKAVRSFLESDTPKVNANISYEIRWALAKLGIEPVGWLFCTMVNARLLDCRPVVQKGETGGGGGGITSLDFQAFVRFGVGKAKDFVARNMKSEDGNSNSLNRIKDADLPSLLKYGGLDALLAWKVAKSQIKELGVQLW